MRSRSTCLGISETYSLDDKVLYSNNPQINSGCTNIYLGQVLCVADKSYPYVLPVNVTTTQAEGDEEEESVTSTVLPTNVPTQGPAVGDITSTAEVWATVTESAAGVQETSGVSSVSPQVGRMARKTAWLTFQ